MKYKKCKLMCGLMVVSLAAASLTACGSTGSAENVTVEDATIDGTTKNTTEENTFAYEEESEEELKDTTVMGIVQSVDGNKVTLSVGGQMGAPGGEKPDGEKPEGEAPTGEKPEGEAPTDGEAPTGEKPEGEAPTDGEAPTGEKPEGTLPTGEAPADSSEQAKTGVLTIGDESVLEKVTRDQDGNETKESITVSDLTEGTMVAITFDADGAITAITVSEGGMQMNGVPGSETGGVESYDAVKEYAENTVVDGENFNSAGTDENAVLVSDGANVTLNNITLNRTSADSSGGDNASFYGVGAGLLTTDGTTIVNGGTFTTDASGGTGIFSYKDGVTYVKDAKIQTSQDTSGGIHVAGGGTLYAWDLDVTTEGESAAAIRSDRGGGTMVVDGGSYTSNGVGSPALYCTADIAVNDATLTANGSEAICMEGLNSIHLFDCDITGNMQDLEQNDTTWDIIVYQSMSGDAEVGNSTMQLQGGTLTSKNGGLIYTTNTESNILLSGVDITYAPESEFFLQCTGNENQRGWGSAGENGADCTFTADAQKMQGDVIWDSISQLDFYMTNGSTLLGAIADDEAYAGDGGEGYCNVYISEDSTWTVTGDSQLTNLYCAGKIVDEDGNSVTVISPDGTILVEGESKYTITAESYSDSVDLSGAAKAASWSEYAVEMPE